MADVAQPPPRATGDLNTDTWTAVSVLVQPNRRLRVLLSDMRLESLARASEGMSARVRIPTALIGAARACESDLRQAFARVLNAPVTLTIEADAPVIEVAPEPTTPRTPITEHPLIKAATLLLGAKVITVQPRRPAT